MPQTAPPNDTDKVPDRDISGFKNKITRKIELLPGTKIFRLDNDQADSGQYGVSGWWSFVKPHLEDVEGAKGRYEQAVLNGVDMSCMVRYMSAVKLEWNKLNYYVEVTTNCRLTAFFGEFAPMCLSEEVRAQYITELNLLLLSRDELYSSMTPEFFGPENKSKVHWQPVDAGPKFKGGPLGLLEGWQLYIPNLKNDYLAEKATRPIKIDAKRGMIKLGQHLGSTLMPSVRRFPRMIKSNFFIDKIGELEISKDPRLSKLKSCLIMIDRLHPSDDPFPAPVPTLIAQEIKTFIQYADILNKSTTVPYKIKQQIKDYGLLGKSFLSGQDYEQVKPLLK